MINEEAACFKELRKMLKIYANACTALEADEFEDAIVDYVADLMETQYNFGVDDAGYPNQR